MSAPLHERVDIALGERSYPILIGPRLLEDAQLLTAHIAARNLLIVTNETVAPLYLGKLQSALAGPTHRDAGSAGRRAAQDAR